MDRSSVLALAAAVLLIAIAVVFFQNRTVNVEERCADLQSRGVVSGSEFEEAEELGCPL